MKLRLSILALSCLVEPPLVAAQTAGPVIGPVEPAPPENVFVLQNYGGKCLDVGQSPQLVGSPVSINDCNRGPSQQVRIVEVNARHDVILRVGTKVIGIKSGEANPRGAAMSSDMSSALGEKTSAVKSDPQVEATSLLELQDEKNRTTVDSQGQVFALDGDSILLASNRKRAVQILDARSKNRTPLAIGKRELADAEFWTFTALDGSKLRPTRGFVRISQLDNSEDSKVEAREAFRNAILGASWGTVIELDQNVSLDLADIPSLHIPAGVTIRGDRRGTHRGPLLAAVSTVTQIPEAPFPHSDTGVLSINGDHVRICGLRMQGTSRDVRDGAPYSNGIAAQDQSIAIVDHNDLFDWSAAAVYVARERDYAIEDNSDGYTQRPMNLRVVRNFIHHQHGYGVTTSDAYPSIEGNTLLYAAHVIASGKGEYNTGQVAFSAYRARYNLTLSAAPDYSSVDEDRNPQPDFDVHGTGSHGFRGTAGQYFEIANNTFLGTNRANFSLRGTPAHQADFHDNVSMLSRDSALENYSNPANKLVSSNNQYSAANPTDTLGVGDFDGDGTEDLFLATGAAWYYSSAGQTEWRLLNTHADKIATLLFGDFDADGRTDVFTQHGYNWDISWGGASPWQNINVSGAILGNAAVGDFIGDKRDDIFVTDGATWLVSDGAENQFVPLRTAATRAPALRFGDFNADGKTDVFSVENGMWPGNGTWTVSFSGTSAPVVLQTNTVDSIADLVVADFDGDGRADVATSPNNLVGEHDWRISLGGTARLALLNGSAPLPLSRAAAIGRFDARHGADVLMWLDHHLGIAPQGTGDLRRHSFVDVDMH